MGWGISDIFYHDFSSTLRHHFECLAQPRSTGEQQVAFSHYKGGRIFMEHAVDWYNWACVWKESLKSGLKV